jgi:hypothetical protein
MLLYLNSFDDDGWRRSWKGYSFNDLNKLAEEGFISEGRRAIAKAFESRSAIAQNAQSPLTLRFARLHGFKLPLL